MPDRLPMRQSMTRYTTRRLLAVAIAVPVLFIGCSSDDSSSSDTTTTKAESSETTAADSETSAETVRFDKEVQQQLKDVGCYEGQVDGDLGPESDAAVVAFQKADGLTEDGELGPETEAALTTAADDGKTVCEASGSGSTSTTEDATTTTAASGGGGSAPCTATALAAGLGNDERPVGFVCQEGFAAVSWTNGEYDAASILQADGDSWGPAPSDICDSQGMGAGYPPEILRDGCVS